MSRPSLTLVPGNPNVDPPVTIRERPGYCLHTHVELDGPARRVHCRECGAEVDAFDFLITLARDFERWSYSRDAARREAEYYGREVEELKRQRRNLRAQVRRASR